MHKELKEQAIKFRLQGKSYNEIIKILGLKSKGTLSCWFKDIKLTNAAQDKLSKNMALAHKRGILAFNVERSERIKKENEDIFLKSVAKVSHINEREMLLIGAALYWGEGYKSNRHPKLSFTNSDREMVVIFMKFIRKILNIDDKRIRTHIHIHPNLNYRKAKVFWSEATGLPISNFRIVDQVSVASAGVRPKNILPFGTLDIRVNSRQEYYRMMGLIKGLIKNV